MINKRTIGLLSIAIPILSPVLISLNLGTSYALCCAVGFTVSLVLSLIVYRLWGYDMLQIYGVSALVFMLFLIMVSSHSYAMFYGYGGVLGYLLVSGICLVMGGSREAQG